MDEFAGYAGFVGTDPSNPTDSLPTLNSVPLFTPNSSSSPSLSVNAMGNIQRFRETPIRALANAGTARVWNLMIDLVAQTGRYPKSATTLDNFEVEGEKRYWAHIAIDRATGQVIAKQIEVVKE
jgi:hypothetical protein